MGTVTISKSLRNIHKIAAKESSRYSCQTIRRVKADGRTVYSTTDGKRLIQVSAPSNGEPDGTTYVGREEWPLAYRGKHEPRALDNPGPFPAVDDVIPETDAATCRFAVDAKLLAELLTVLADTADDVKHIVVFSVADAKHAIRLDVEHPVNGCTALGVIMPINVT